MNIDFKKNITLITLLILFLIFFIKVKNIHAAYFRFDPNSINNSLNNNFEIKLILEPEIDKIYSTDVYIDYDSSVLKVVNIKPENIFPTVFNDISTNNKIYIAAMFNNTNSFTSSSSAIATITFQGLKDGSVDLSFDCDNSKIIKNDLSGTNVLNCSKNNNALITIGTGLNNDQITNSLPDSLPKSGVFDNVIKIGIPGVILLFFGIVFKLFI